MELVRRRDTSSEGEDKLGVDYGAPASHDVIVEDIFSCD